MSAPARLVVVGFISNVYTFLCLLHAAAAIWLQGALTNIYLCSSPDVEGISGKYYDNCKPVASTPASYDTATAAKLWAVSEELTQAYAKAPAAV
jgi:hypothetical protein